MIRKPKLNIEDHRTLTLWACDCAEHVLPYFEKKYPKDDRPMKAIKVGRTWVSERLPMKMKVIRTASLDAHAVARSVDDPAARAAARAAGHAVATVHVWSHARAAADYAVKATLVLGVAPEREWQYQHLPEHLRSIVFPSR